MKRRIALVIMIIFYMVAGANHFRSPATYIALMPPYFPQPSLLNIIAGIAEILLAFLLCFPASRRLGAYGIVVLMIVFIPVHIYFIQAGNCIPGIKCFPAWVGWTRLILIQPMLMAWAWLCRK